MLRYVTPTLYVDEDKALPSMRPAEAERYIRLLAQRHGPYVAPSWPAAYRILRAIGLSAEESRHRINFARTGDIYATRTAARRRQQRPARLGA